MQIIRFIAIFFLSLIFVQGQGLRDIADSKGKLIGTAINGFFVAYGDQVEANINNTLAYWLYPDFDKWVTYQQTLKREYNCYVPENEFKMPSLLPNRPADPFNVQVSDLNVADITTLQALANTYGVNHIRGHALIWYNSAPDWLKTAVVDESWTSSQIHAFATSYIKAAVTATKDMVYEWDVINEAIQDSQTAAIDYRTTENGNATPVWYANVDDMQDFFDACFTAAHEANPKLRLYYNDYGIRYSSRQKTQDMLAIVGDMKSRGIPITGVGMQCHMRGPDQSDAFREPSNYLDLMEATMQELDKLCLDASITELDIRLVTDDPAAEGNVTATQLATQAQMYQDVVTMAFDQPNCPAILTWGFSDAYSWIPNFAPGEGHALPFDETYDSSVFNTGSWNPTAASFDKKSAYYGIETALNNLPDTVNYVTTHPSLFPTRRYEFEAYLGRDGGLNGVDFYDTTPGNNGNPAWTDDVDVFGNLGPGGLGWTATGEWVQYEVDLPAHGLYEIKVNAATTFAAPALKVSVNGQVIDTIALSNTGANNIYQDFTTTVALPADSAATLRFEFAPGNANLNYFEITPLEINIFDRDQDGISDAYETHLTGCHLAASGIEALLDYAYLEPLCLEGSTGNLSYTRRPSADLAHSLVLESCSDLTSWAPLAITPAETPLTGDLTRYELSTSTATPKQFYRHKIIIP